MIWLPAIVIWAALVGVGAYYLREWWRVGRDPKRGTIIPLFGPPEGLSPMALFFIYRRGTAEDIAINAGALGSLAELIRRRLIHTVDGPQGPRIVRGEGGDANGLQPDLQRFLERLLPGDRDAGTDEFRTAAWAYWQDVHGMLSKRILSYNLRITLTGAAILAGATLLTVLLVNWLMPPGNEGALIGAGFVASILVFSALSLRRSRIRSQRLVALGLGAAGFFILLVVMVVVLIAIGGYAGPARATVLAGLFLTTPLVAWAWGVLMALTPAGRQLADAVEGFRTFIAVADAGRHAIENAPDPTQDRLDALMPYAIALHVEAGWVNALAARLPVETFRAVDAKKA